MDLRAPFVSFSFQIKIFMTVEKKQVFTGISEWIILLPEQSVSLQERVMTA